MTDQLLFTLDGKVVAARPGETIWQVAQREGTTIPHLCWLPEPSYRADGNCRACMVEVEGVSRELCGGTHVGTTSEGDLFKVLAENRAGDTVSVEFYRDGSLQSTEVTLD
ncbi:hypothetical protein LCGC14_2851500 [marine sediment metagenome]|uniref:Threonyl/alanyl tRNA synthetase SAD domain-containing protein n=1 Tax=marine sediment metagenome TaxID=412755 RepID=A0A0F9AZ60_9ZZZZ